MVFVWRVLLLLTQTLLFLLVLCSELNLKMAQMGYSTLNTFHLTSIRGQIFLG